MKIHEWGDIADDYMCESQNSNLLLGNGASIAIWKSFGYNNLFTTARCELDDETRLTCKEADYFGELDTFNFESVLLGLDYTILATKVYGQSSAMYTKSRQHIQSALIAAIHHVHVPRTQLANKFLKTLAIEFSHYQRIYTTNYDLIAYWTINNLREKLSDGFIEESFLPEDERHHDRSSEFWFLHGGLHLYIDQDAPLTNNSFKKITHEQGRNLLNTLGEFPDSMNGSILVVTEGQSKDKQLAISRSNYLRYAFDRFKQMEGSLVVFGHSLSKWDDHIVKAINAAPLERIAIGLHNPENGFEAKADEIRSKLPKHRACLDFFRSGTHPFGDTNNLVESSSED